LGGGEKARDARAKGGIVIKRRAAGKGEVGGGATAIGDRGARAVGMGVPVGADAATLIVFYHCCTAVRTWIRVLARVDSIGASGSVGSGNDN